jgi:hypothetical protein
MRRDFAPGNATPTFNPDSACEIDTDVRARRKPAAAKTPKRTASRSCLALGLPLRFVSPDYPMHKADWPLKGTGLLSSLRRGYARRSTLFPTAESGFNPLSRMN